MMKILGGFTMKRKIIALSLMLGWTVFLGACSQPTEEQTLPADETQLEQTQPGNEPVTPEGTEAPSSPESAVPEETQPSDPLKSDLKEEPTDASQPSDTGSMTEPEPTAPAPPTN
jgi:PBP1b-binding outer membrane lipoprotein LpoB